MEPVYEISMHCYMLGLHANVFGKKSDAEVCKRIHYSVKEYILFNSNNICNKCNIKG